MKKWKTVSDDVVFAVCDRFMVGDKVTDIASWVAREKGVAFNREEIYPLLSEGRTRGLIRLIPPTEATIAQRIRDLLAKNQSRAWPGRITVANLGAGAGAEHVATTAADAAMHTINEIWAHKCSRLGRKAKTRFLPKELRQSSRSEKDHEDWDTAVHVGLGAGRTTMRVAKFLAGNLRSLGDDRPNLYLHALTSGHSVENPQTAPMYYFSFFDDLRGIRWMAFYTPPYVRQEDYAALGTLPGVHPAYEARKDIDLVITAFGSSDEDHGDFTRFMRRYPDLLKPDLDQLHAAGWVGDVQYRPYSAAGPITAPTKFRAATLFELADFVRMAADPEKAVILVAGPCRMCGALRGHALMPLLREPSLAVWSHLVIDAETANQCISLA